LRELDTTNAKKLLKMFKSTKYCTLSTSSNDKPHATIVQPAITSNWEILVFSHHLSKKARNISQNKNVWISVGNTGIFKVPRAIYIEGTATVEQLTGESFQFFLSHHGRYSKRIFLKHVKGELDKFILIKITPRKIMTVGIFDKPEKTLSFALPSRKPG